MREKYFLNLQKLPTFREDKDYLKKIYKIKVRHFFILVKRATGASFVFAILYLESKQIDPSVASVVHNANSQKCILSV